MAADWGAGGAASAQEPKLGTVPLGLPTSLLAVKVSLTAFGLDGAVFLTELAEGGVEDLRTVVLLLLPCLLEPDLTCIGYSSRRLITRL